MKKLITLIALSLLMTGCLNNATKPVQINYSFQGTPNVFMPSRSGITAVSETTYDSLELGKSIDYRMISVSLPVSVYIYPKLLTEKQTIDQELRDAVNSVIHFAQQDKATSITSLREHKKFTFEETSYSYNRVEVNKKIAEHILIANYGDNILKIRMQTANTPDTGKLVKMFALATAQHAKKITSKPL